MKKLCDGCKTNLQKIYPPFSSFQNGSDRIKICEIDGCLNMLLDI